MKRSEMVRKMVEFADKTTFPEEATKENVMEVILVFLEEQGMLPPPLPGKSHVKVNARCKWEAE
jgi:hypothetical protein